MTWVFLRDSQENVLFVRDFAKAGDSCSDCFGWTTQDKSRESSRFQILKYVSKQPPAPVYTPESNISVLIRFGVPARFIGTEQDGVLTIIDAANSFCVWSMQAYEGNMFTLTHPTKAMLAVVGDSIGFENMELDWHKLFHIDEYIENKPSHQLSIVGPSIVEPNIPSRVESNITKEENTKYEQKYEPHISPVKESSPLVQNPSESDDYVLETQPLKTEEKPKGILKNSVYIEEPLKSEDLTFNPGPRRSSRVRQSSFDTGQAQTPPGCILDYKGRFLIRGKSNELIFAKKLFKNTSESAVLICFYSVNEEMELSPFLIHGENYMVVAQCLDTGLYLSANTTTLSEESNLSSNTMFLFKKLPHNPLAFSLVHSQSQKTVQTEKNGSVFLGMQNDPVNFSFLLHIPNAMHSNSIIGKASPYLSAVAAGTGIFSSIMLVANAVKPQQSVPVSSKLEVQNLIEDNEQVELNPEEFNQEELMEHEMMEQEMEHIEENVDYNDFDIYDDYHE